MARSFAGRLEDRHIKATRKLTRPARRSQAAFSVDVVIVSHQDVMNALRGQREKVEMRTIVVYALLSLDGVAQDPDEFVTDWDEAMDANLAAVIGTQDAVVLGRRSYAEWARYWPGSHVEPFATFINEVRKHVATSTPLDLEWANASAVEGELSAFVRDLKQRSGGDIGIHASITVAQALLAADLVDELRLVIAPTIAGRGRRLLDGLPSIRLELVSSQVSPTGSLLVHYRVIH